MSTLGLSNLQSNGGVTTIPILNVNALYVGGVLYDEGTNQSVAGLQAQINQINNEINQIEAITNRIDFNTAPALVGNLVITETNKNSVLLTAIQSINTQIADLNKFDLTAISASPPGAIIITPTTTNQALKALIDTINGQIASINNSITAINLKLAHFSTFNYGADVMSGIADGTGFAAAVSGGSAAGNGLFVYPNTTSQSTQISLISDTSKDINIRGGYRTTIKGGTNGSISSRNIIDIGDETDEIKIGRNQGLAKFPLIKIGVDSGLGGNASTTTFQGDVYFSSYSAYVPGLTPVLYADTTPGVKLGNANNFTSDPTFSGLDVIGVGVAPITLSAATGVIAVTALAGGIAMTTGLGLMALQCGAGGFSLSTGAGALSMNTGAGLMNLATSSANIEMSTLTGNVSIGAGKAVGGSAGNVTLNAAGDVIIQPDVETEIYKTAFVEFNDNATAPATTANRLYQQADELYWNGQQVSSATPKLFAGHDILIDSTTSQIKSIATNTYEFPTQTTALGSLFPTPSQLGYSNVKIFSDIGDPTPISNGLWNLNMRPTGTLGFPTFSNIPPIVRSATQVIFFDDANGGVHSYNPSTLDWTYNILSVNRNDTTPLFFRSASIVPVRAGLPAGYNNGGLLVSGNFNAARVGANSFTTNITNGVFFWDFATTSVDTLGLTSATNFEMVVEAVPVTTWQLATRNVLFFAAATTTSPSFVTQLLSYVFDGAAGATDTLVSNNVLPIAQGIVFNQEVTIGTFTLASARTYSIAVNSFLGNNGASPLPAKIGIYLFNGTQEILQGSTISYNLIVSGAEPYNQTFPAFNYPATTAGQQYRIKVTTAFQQVPVTSTQVSGNTATPFCLANGTLQGNWTFVDSLGYSLTRRVSTLAAYSTASQCWVFMGGNQFRSTNNLNYAQLVYFAASAPNFGATSVNNITAATPGAWNTARPGITQSNFDATGNLYFCGDFTQNATITQTPYNFINNNFAVTLSGMRNMNTNGGNGDFLLHEAPATFFAPNNVVNTIRATMPAAQVIPYLYENVATYGQNPSLTGINVPLNCTQVNNVNTTIQPFTSFFLGTSTFTYDELIINAAGLPASLSGQNPVLQYMDIWLPASTQLLSLNIQLFLGTSITQFANYSRNVIGGQVSQFLTGPAQINVGGGGQASLFRVYAIDLFGNSASFPRPFTSNSSFRIRVTINVPPTNNWSWRAIFPNLPGSVPPMSVCMSRAENPMTNVSPGDQEISVSVPTLTIPNGANYRFGFLPVGITNINQAWLRAGFIGGGGTRYTAGLDANVFGGQVDNSAYVPAIAGIPQFNNMLQIPGALGTRPSFAVQSLVANNLQNIFKCCVGANGSTLNVVEWNASTASQNPLGIGIPNALVTIGRDTNDGTGNSVFIVARSATSSNPFIAAYHFTTRSLSNVLRFQTSLRYNTGQLGITANEVIFEGRFSTIALTADDNNRDSWIVESIQGNIDFSTFN